MRLSSLSKTKMRRLLRDHALNTTLPHETAAHAARHMRDADVGALPVVSPEGDLVGMLSERDIVRRCVGQGLDPARVTVAEIMTANVYTIDRGSPMNAAIAIMMEHNIRHLPVVSGRRLLGVVSLRRIVAEYRKGILAAQNNPLSLMAAKAAAALGSRAH